MALRWFEMDIDQAYLAALDGRHTARYSVPGVDMKNAYEKVQKWTEELITREIFNIHLIDPDTQVSHQILENGRWIPLPEKNAGLEAKV
ncbi:MAG: hypothetical protein Q7R96_03795 [Nanoarchaeota archaeon]|nr:hypothetical protein [Nanoarchaeota archaeon]